METQHASISLSRAVGIKKGDIISLVGGGGKTTTMYHLADELVKKGHRIIVTTTTHIFPPDSKYTEIFTKDTDEVRKVLDRRKLLVLADRFDPEKGKLTGINASRVKELIEVADNIIIEADGSRNLPFKAPEKHEPVIPESSTVVIHLTGLDVVNKPLTSDYAHRIERIKEITGIDNGDPITPEVIAKTVLHPSGGKKQVPENASFIPLLNKADTFSDINAAGDIAGRLISGGIGKVVITGHRSDPVFIKPVTSRSFVSAVILAAGASSRMGRPKLELEIDGVNLLERTIKNVIRSIADEIILVLQPDKMPVDLKEYPGIKVVINDMWKTGQSSSMKAGLKAVSGRSGGALFFMGDQPFVTPDIINELIMSFMETDKPVTVPLYRGKRGAPVLFKRSVYQELLRVEGDRGGRDLINRYPADFVDIDSEYASFDIDTPEEFERLKKILLSKV